jgi:hypothetical protein
LAQQSQPVSDLTGCGADLKRIEFTVGDW